MDVLFHKNSKFEMAQLKVIWKRKRGSARRNMRFGNFVTQETGTGPETGGLLVGAPSVFG